MKLFELASQLAPLMVPIVGGTGLVNDEVIATYDAQAAELAARYDQPALLESYSPVEDLIASTSADSLALDIGAGSGRDAAWLASKGYEVVAVEPSSGMRDEAQRRHEDTRIRWLDDRLPGLVNGGGIPGQCGGVKAGH